MFVYVTHSEAFYEGVMKLIAEGFSDSAIAVEVGISRGTVRRWRCRPEPPTAIRRKRLAASWKVEEAPAYCYLLGAYLGDGTVSVPSPSSPFVAIVNDRRYPGISGEILAAMRATFPGSAARSHPSSVGLSDVLCISHPAVLRAFPQHGPGRKHLRPIVLADWQLALTRANPGSLIRGLIHSDGCRTENSFRTRLPSGRTAKYSYVRYFFSNKSADIRGIFIEHCALLGVRVTQSNPRNLSVAHRDSVALLDRFVGPKA
jgi:hypothetical protein